MCSEGPPGGKQLYTPDRREAKNIPAEVINMTRRTFTQTVAGVALSATALKPFRLGAGPLPLERDEMAGVPLKISIMLWTVFGNLPFEQRLEKVAEAGYHNVQLGGECAKWSEDDFRNVNRRRRELGISFDCMGGIPHGLVDPREREAFLSDLRGMLPIIERIECPAIIFVSGNVVPAMSRQAQHESIVEGLKRAAEIADAKGVTLLLETIDLPENPKIYLWSMAECFKIIGEVGHPRVKALYDFYHEQISEGNLISKLVKNIDKVGGVHIADVPGRHEPGTGEINYPNIYRKLAKLNFQGTMAMEFIPSGDAVQSLRKAREEALKAART